MSGFGKDGLGGAEGGAGQGTGQGAGQGTGQGTGQGAGGRGRLWDDLAGVAGGAFAVLAGARQEAEAAMRSQLDAMVQRLELVRREEFDAALEVARRAREHAAALEVRLAALEARLDGTAAAGPAVATGQADVATDPIEAASSVAPAAVHPAAGGMAAVEKVDPPRDV